MQIVKMAKFGDDDNLNMHTVMDCLGCCLAFFLDRSSGVDGTTAVARLFSGNLLSEEQLREALMEVIKARTRVQFRVPDTFLPEELKDQYWNRLSKVAIIIEGWMLDLTRLSPGISQTYSS